MHKLEYFITHNYNLAMRKLQEHINSGEPEAVIIALTCCVIFVGLENLRFNHREAIKHLTKGSQIIVKTIDMDRLYGFTSKSQQSHMPMGSLISDNDTMGIIECFRHLELSQRLFAFEVPLAVNSRLCQTMRSHTNDVVPPYFSSLTQAHKIVSAFVTEVMSTDYEATAQRGNPDFWASPSVKQQHRALFKRGITILERYQAYMSSLDLSSIGPRERASYYQDLLQTFSMQGMIGMLPLPVNAQQHKRGTLGSIVHYAEKLLEEKKALATHTDACLDYTMEPGVTASLYYSWVYTDDPELKSKALRLMSESFGREGPWDGKALVKLAQVYNDRWITETSELSNTSSPRWGSSMDCLKLFASLRVTEW
ncbi:hypothetical protein S40293_00048 [Stachybotrys chartarum IBT 40293]|nr:hypothetical protein S40293_00048 [Stachybotrys chartarum IBT 40293]